MAGVTACQVAFARAMKDAFPGMPNILTAAAGGALAAFVAATPSEKVMVVHGDRVKDWEASLKKWTEAGQNDLKPQKPSYLETMRMIHARWGLRGFWHGALCTAGRDAGFVIAYLEGGKYLGKKNEPYAPNGEWAKWGGALAAAIIGGTMTHPLDTKKTRQQRGERVSLAVAPWKGCRHRMVRSMLAVPLLAFAKEFLSAQARQRP